MAEQCADACCDDRCQQPQRATTVIAVTTVYVVATTFFSGLLESGLVPALIPIGLLSGLSAVVCLLLIVAVANNKIQGLAMMRALGMLIAGLPCLPWFIDSARNLAFGVLPPYWAVKAFWVACDHGTWWPYLAGVAYNLAVGWLLLRRFLAKNTRRRYLGWRRLGRGAYGVGSMSGRRPSIRSASMRAEPHAIVQPTCPWPVL
jgi:hypothetical protein